MSGFDVHTDKAIKELRARLDVAIRERDEARRERDEARAVLANMQTAIQLAADAASDCVGLDLVIAVSRRVDASDARIAAAEMARDVRTVRVLVGLENICDSAIAARDMAASCVLGCSIPRARNVLGAAVDPDATDEQIAAAIRAARGQA